MSVSPSSKRMENSLSSKPIIFPDETSSLCTVFYCWRRRWRCFCFCCCGCCYCVSCLVVVVVYIDVILTSSLRWPFSGMLHRRVPDRGCRVVSFLRRQNFITSKQSRSVNVALELPWVPEGSRSRRVGAEALPRPQCPAARDLGPSSPRARNLWNPNCVSQSSTSPLLPLRPTPIPQYLQFPSFQLPPVRGLIPAASSHPTEVTLQWDVAQESSRPRLSSRFLPPQAKFHHEQAIPALANWEIPSAGIPQGSYPDRPVGQQSRAGMMPRTYRVHGMDWHSSGGSGGPCFVGGGNPGNEGMQVGIGLTISERAWNRDLEWRGGGILSLPFPHPTRTPSPFTFSQCAVLFVRSYITPYIE